MRRRLPLSILLLLALAVLAAACAEEPTGVSSEESVLSVSSAPESSIPDEEPLSKPEPSFDEEPSTEEPSSEQPSEEESEEESSEDTSSGFSPWRGEEEPDLEGWRSPSIPEDGFSLLARSLTLRPGESAEIKYEFAPVGAAGHDLTWSSSDETVVTVENGRVHAVSAGRATVRAQTRSGRSAECSVTVLGDGSLTTLGALAKKLVDEQTDGSFSGWQFARYDLDLDGNAELFVRRVGENGVPAVTVYTAGGERLFSVSTGSGEEWAIWRRVDNGKRYFLLSYTEGTESGGSRSVLEEVAASTSPSVSRIFYRETAPDGSVTYFVSSGVCEESAYQWQKEAYFSSNRQIPGTVLTWVTGNTATEVDNALRATKLPTEF